MPSTSLGSKGGARRKNRSNNASILCKKENIEYASGADDFLLSEMGTLVIDDSVHSVSAYNARNGDIVNVGLKIRNDKL